jgi:hypothetical protein
MKRFPLLPGLMIVLVVTCGGTSQALTGKSLSAYGIDPASVARVEILYYPEQILTRFGFTPEMLEKLYRYKVEVKEFTEATSRQRLVTALRETSMSPTGSSHDLRTAVLLYDNNGKRLLSLYFDRTGRNGMVNSESVSIDDGVYRWAKSMMKGFAD